jgi:hypothetical protein
MIVFITLIIKIIQSLIIANDIPREGKRIKITWLPDNRLAKNCYIGSEGVVEKINEDGSFHLNMGKSHLIVTNSRYKFVYLK